MDWKREEMVEHPVGLPWTVVLERGAEGDLVASMRELSFLTATGRTDKTAARDLFDALRSALDAVLEQGDTVPLPRGESLPWQRGDEPKVQG